MLRRMRLALLLTLLVLGLVSTFSATAAPPYEIEYTYYSEPEKINECGWKLIGCSGTYRSGCQTSWYDIYNWGEC